MRPVKHRLRTCLAVLLALALGGCVWLRLLEVKGQLADFDQNFRVEVADQHFVVHLLHPVMLSEDFTYLTKLNPSRIAAAPGGDRWYMDFKHAVPRGRAQAEQRLVFTMTLTPDHKLAAFAFSPLFLEMAPPAFLEASIRSLGSGKVDQGKRQLKVDPEDLPKLTAKLPNRQAILNVLGLPAEEQVKDDLKVLVYRFKAEAVPVDPDYEKRRLAEAKLYFDPGKDELVRLSGRFVGLKLASDYRKLTRQPEPVREAAALGD
jgi:hypothetical protein